MATNSKSIFRDLSKQFKLIISGNQIDSIEKVQPAKTEEPKRSNGKESTGPVEFPSYIQRYLKEFLNKIKTDYRREGKIHLKQLIQDIDDMCDNEPRTNRAIETRAAEIVRADNSSVNITINAKDKKQVKFIEELNLKHKIPEKFRSAVSDYAKYGNSIWVLSLGEGGVGGITAVDIRKLNHRYEFIPAEVQDFKSKSQGLSETDRMKVYLDGISELSDVSYFETYLLGYDVGDYLLPPWNVVHFRHKPHNSMFLPFGEPPYVKSLAPYKKWDTISMLRAALLAAGLPREMIGFKLDNLTSTELMEKLTELAAKYENTGLRKPAKEGQGIGETLFYAMETMEIEYKSPDLKMPDEADLELAIDDMIVGTFMPRELLEQKDGFGTGSETSIIEKSRFLYRMVYLDQVTTLETLSDFYKLAMILSGDFSLDEIDFSLSLPFPESMVSDDLINNQSNLIRLTNDTIEFFTNNLVGEGNTLPPDVIKKIMHEILPFHTEWLDDILKDVSKSVVKDKETENSANENFKEFVNRTESYKSKVFKEESQFRNSSKLMYELISDYYIKPGRKNGNRLLESKMKFNENKLTEKFISESIYDIKKKNTKYIDYWDKGQHVVLSKSEASYHVQHLDKMLKSNTSTGKISFKEDESKFAKQTKKKKGK